MAVINRMLHRCAKRGESRNTNPAYTTFSGESGDRDFATRRVEGGLPRQTGGSRNSQECPAGYFDPPDGSHGGRGLLAGIPGGRRGAGRWFLGLAVPRLRPGRALRACNLLPESTEDRPQVSVSRQNRGRLSTESTACLCTPWARRRLRAAVGGDVWVSGGVRRRVSTRRRLSDRREARRLTASGTTCILRDPLV